MMDTAVSKRETWFERWRLFRSRLRPRRRLRLEETLSLGDRRFIALIAFEGSHFLVGGTSSTLSLLARLEANDQPGLGLASIDSVCASGETR